MRTNRIGGLVVLATLALSPAARAQDDAAEPETEAETATEAEAPTGSRDAEARSVFEAGTMAFDDARYADALDYFQRAYELSGRHVLLHNIGVARRPSAARRGRARGLRAVPGRSSGASPAP